MIPDEILKIIHNTTYGSKEMTIKILEKISDQEFEDAVEILRYASRMHPTMLILTNILREIKERRRRPRELLNELRRLDEDISRNMCKVIGKESIVMTFSRSKTLLNIFRNLGEWGYIKKIYLSEGRPTNEGISFAEDLSKMGIDTVLTIDIALPNLVGKVDVVIIGCDAILPNNSVVNKVGSTALAIAAKHYEKNFIVAGDEYKYSSKMNIEIKYGPITDIYSGSVNRIEVYNPYFEVIPAQLITYIVTNKEIIKPV